jgi:hypothetical protein
VTAKISFLSAKLMYHSGHLVPKSKKPHIYFSILNWIKQNGKPLWYKIINHFTSKISENAVQSIKNKLLHIPSQRSEESCSEIHGQRMGTFMIPMEKLTYTSVWPTL